MKLSSALRIAVLALVAFVGEEKMGLAGPTTGDAGLCTLCK